MRKPTGAVSSARQGNGRRTWFKTIAHARKFYAAQRAAGHALECFVDYSNRAAICSVWVSDTARRRRTEKS